MAAALCAAGALAWLPVNPERAGDSDTAELAYDALIGSEFEQTHGWHVNLMPPDVLREFPAGWEERVLCQNFSHLTVTVPAAVDLIAAKMKRGEARDLAHKKYAEELGLV